jgi:hypothetical protein
MMRLSRSLNISGAMVFLAYGALSVVECQAPPSPGKTDPAPSQSAPVEGGAQKPYDPALRPLADDLFKNAQQVKLIVDENRADRDKDALKTALDQVQFDAQKLQQLVPTQPPIKVRGGAMTVRTTRLTLRGEHGNDCVVLQNPADHPVQLQFVEDITVQGWTPTSKTLSGNWKVDLYGRDSKGNHGADGIELAYTDSCMESGTNYPGVTIKSIGTTNQYFYDFRDARTGTDEDGITRIKRFKNPTCSQHLPHPTNGDEDTCELMFDIKVNDIQFKHCVNGECLVQIVQQ